MKDQSNTKIAKDYVCQRYDVPEALARRVTAEWCAVHRPAYYDIDRSRERMSLALAQTRTYHLRKPDVPPGTIIKTESAANVLECVDTPLRKRFPVIDELIAWVGQTQGGFTTLGRVFITRLEANSNIGRHIDQGYYFDNLHRHHFILRSQETKFCWDDQFTTMHAGEAWRVNNSIPHWVENTSAPRTTIIFDAA